MPLTKAEFKLLDTLDRVVGNTLPMEWLKPAKRAMVKRMRVKGFISKRNMNSGWVKPTQAGIAAWRKMR